MKAIKSIIYGGPEVLQLENIAKPQIGPNDILVKNYCTSITAASTFMRAGTPKFGRLFIGLTKPKTTIQGTDLSGVVVAIGSSVTKYKIGQEIIAETGIKCGAYAEFTALNENDPIVIKPKEASFREAAGMVDGGLTAMAFLTQVVQLKAKQHILINGGSGSIGTAAIQIAKNKGAIITAVSSSKNHKLLLKLGADFCIDYKKDDFTKQNTKYDVIFDTVGKLSVKKAKNALSKNGVYLTPVLSTSVLFKIMLNNPFSSKKVRFSATGLRKKDLIQNDFNILCNWVSESKFTTVIDRVYKLEEIQNAHRYVEEGHKVGNVIVEIACA